jgi:hypothetical protein
MRRLAVVLGGLAAVLWVAAPASAFAHDRVRNPFLHSLLDVFSLAVVTAPLWTAYLWRAKALGGRAAPDAPSQSLRRRRGLMLALIAVVQVPVAVVAFVPIVQPAVHVVSMVGALALTGASLLYVRRLATSPATEHAPEPR